MASKAGNTASRLSHTPGQARGFHFGMLTVPALPLRGTRHGCIGRQPRPAGKRKPLLDGASFECLAASMVGHVTKPMRMGALVEALNQAKARDAR